MERIGINMVMDINHITEFLTNQKLLKYFRSFDDLSTTIRNFQTKFHFITFITFFCMLYDRISNKSSPPYKILIIVNLFLNTLSAVNKF